MSKRVGGRCLVCGARDRKIFRRTAIKRSKKNNLVARGGNYN